MKTKSKRTVFAVCINNTGYPASLEAGKLYQVIPDPKAEKHGLIRVIDESGEDYGYPSERFFVLDVPHALEKALRALPSARQPNTYEDSSRQETKTSPALKKRTTSKSANKKRS